MILCGLIDCGIEEKIEIPKETNSDRNTALYNSDIKSVNKKKFKKNSKIQDDAKTICIKNALNKIEYLDSKDLNKANEGIVLKFFFKMGFLAETNKNDSETFFNLSADAILNSSLFTLHEIKDQKGGKEDVNILFVKI